MRLPPLLRSPFGSLLLSDSLLLLAVMVGHVTIPWLIAQSGGASDLARYGATSAVMAIVAMPLLSPLGDRYSKRWLITVALAAFAASAAVLAWWTGSHGYQLNALLVLQVVPVMAMAIVQPANTSFVAEIVPTSDLTRAVSWQQTAQSLGRLAGPALGGMALAIAGTEATLWLYAALLLLATAFAMRLPRGNPLPKSTVATGWWSDIRAGLKANWLVPIERGWMASNFVSWLFLFPAFTMLVPLKVLSLELSALWLGLCEAALALGMLAGALGLSRWWMGRYGRFNTRVFCAALQGIGLAVAGITTTPSVLVAAFAFVGMANSAMVLVGQTHRTLARPIAFRARMSAGSIMTSQIAASLGPMLAGAALLRWSIEGVYTAFGLLGGLAALSIALVPGFRALMALEHHEVEGWYGTAYPKAFT